MIIFDGDDAGGGRTEGKAWVASVSGYKSESWCDKLKQ